MNRLTDKLNFTAFSGVIFDLDGLVLDTELTYFWAWKKAAKEMGYEFSDSYCLTLSGMHQSDLQQNLLNYWGGGFDLKKFALLSGKYWLQYVEQQGIPVKKGFFTLIDILQKKHLPYCLATNSSKKNAFTCLKFAGLPQVFSIIVSAEQVQQSKPAPDIFLLAAEKLSIPIEQCLILEDSKIGIDAASKAGGISVYIAEESLYDQIVADEANYYFNDLAEVANIL